MKLARCTVLLAFVCVVVACSCISPTIEREMEERDLVFSAKVIDYLPPAPHYVERGGKSVRVWSGGDMAGWVMAPFQVWKGQPSDTLTVYSEVSDAACGARFTVGEEYVVFADLEDTDTKYHHVSQFPKGARFPVATTHTCTLNQPINGPLKSIWDLGSRLPSAPDSPVDTVKLGD